MVITVSWKSSSEPGGGADYTLREPRTAGPWVRGTPLERDPSGDTRSLEELLERWARDTGTTTAMTFAVLAERYDVFHYCEGFCVQHRRVTPDVVIGREESGLLPTREALAEHLAGALGLPVRAPAAEVDF
jgi:hypothetical protein